MSTDPKKTRDISGDEAQIVDFTYSVKWEETQIPFERRMEKYSKYSFLPQHLEVRRLQFTRPMLHLFSPCSCRRCPRLSQQPHVSVYTASE